MQTNRANQAPRDDFAAIKTALLFLAGIVFVSIGGFAIIAGMTVQAALSGVALAALGGVNLYLAFHLFSTH